MALAAPQRFVDAFVRQRGHGKARMGDAQPGYFFGQDEAGGFHGLPFGPCLHHAADVLEAFSQDQLMHLTHEPHVDRNRWGFAIRTLLTGLFRRLFDSSY
jgi:hypothetical protein